MRFFAGIGSRETPQDILDIFKKVSLFLYKKGFVLRSGAAPGADAAFEAGWEEDNKEIYLPWRGFNGNQSYLFKITQEALDLAAKYHPAWNRLSDAAKKLMARNCYQVLGFDLKTPAEFVVCWTIDASGKGGTGQALRIAKDYNIPIFDFGKKENIDKFREYCRKL